jgi:Tfp pilus assembly protein PilF
VKLSAERMDLDERFIAGDRAALVDEYTKLAETESDAGLYRRLGICLDDSGQPEGAQKAFKKAVSMDHSDSISKRRLLRLEFKAMPRRTAKKKVAKAKPVEAEASA